MIGAIILPLLLVVSPGPASTPTDDYPKNPRIDIEHYRFELRFGDADNVIRGDAEISARYLFDGDSNLRLDLAQVTPERSGQGMTVTAVQMGGRDLDYRHVDDQLFIDLGRTVKASELVRVRVIYSGTPAASLRFGANKHGDRTIFSDNWPNRARHWLPTVDHPYDKATSEMIVTAPAHYQVVSNGLLVEETDSGDGTRLTHWHQSVPIATWLYVVGVAQFAVQQLGLCEGVAIQTWVAYQDREAGFHDFAEPTCDVLAFYSREVGPFSYEKLANIVSPSVGGGMEAASAILYGEASVSGLREVRWQNVIIHEIAHQWFGNSVTEYDWDDVWLSEGFATYFTLLYREHARGRDDFVLGLVNSRERVRAFYAERPDYRIVHDNLHDMSQVTTGMTYQKGAWVLHMLRERIGKAQFWGGIREYYRRYRDSNATTTDFRRVMEEASGDSLEHFFDQWLYRGGIPELRIDWQFDTAKSQATVSVLQVGSGPHFDFPLELSFIASDGTAERVAVPVRSGMQSIEYFNLSSVPDQMVVDPDTRLLARWSVERGP